jgi:LEA14-like dessication related protein
MKRLSVLAPLLLLALFMSSCTDIKAPISTFNRFEISNVGLSKADLVFVFDVENPNDIPLGIKDITYNIALDGNHITNGTSEGFHMNAKEKTTVRLPIELIYADLLGTASNLAHKFIMRDGTVTYKIGGEITVVDNIGFSARVPLDSEGQIKLF